MSRVKEHTCYIAVQPGTGYIEVLDVRHITLPSPTHTPISYHSFKKPNSISVSRPNSDVSFYPPKTTHVFMPFIVSTVLCIHISHATHLFSHTIFLMHRYVQCTCLWTLTASIVFSLYYATHLLSSSPYPSLLAQLCVGGDWIFKHSCKRGSPAEHGTNPLGLYYVT
jgi:hypothetical protein